MSLLSQIQQTTHHAKQVGALYSLTTAQEIVVDHGIPFIVRILEKLEKKENYQAKKEQEKVNPFLPYEEDLFVCDLSATHLCLLNKFNVVDNHILVITRDFQSQEDWITEADFTALYLCMQELDGLAFYNAGFAAGASQPHKHLQLIPFNDDLDAFSVPIEVALKQIEWQTSEPTQIAVFPFVHRIIAVPENFDGKILFELYETLLKSLNFIEKPLTGDRQTYPYNLLITRRWMLLVKRAQDNYERISVNSLGFAGALLVRNYPQLEFLKQLTPLQLLQRVADQPKNSR